MATKQIDRQIELTVEEADELRRVQNRIDEDMRQRFRFLRHRLEQEQLTPDEHQELKALVVSAEDINLLRMELLAEAARSRGITLADIVRSLSISPLIP